MYLLLWLIGSRLILGMNTPSEASSNHASPAEVIDALNLVFGKQTTNRAVHAKGIVLEGRWTPSPSAVTLSKAPHFRQAVPVTIRFSDFAGVPSISDTDPLASPRGLALKFHLPDGSETDLVVHSYNGFPSATAADFRDLLIALGTSGPGVPKPTPADKYLASHPAAKAFAEQQPPPPVSYATTNYYGVNSFKFTNEKGQAAFGRYRIEPQAGSHFLTKEEISKAVPNYLLEEIRERVSRSPVRFNIYVQLPEPGDKIADPSIAWPESRKKVDIGILEITKVIPDNEGAQRTLLFMPGVLPVGIESADPMIEFRNDSYPISYDRRHHHSN